MNEPKPKKVVFVCTGNTCRSPMAEAIFSAECKKRGLENVEVFSAGIRISETEKTLHPNARAVLTKKGLSLDGFSSKGLDKKTLKKADLIVCMTDEQRDIVMDMRWNVLTEKEKEKAKNNAVSFFELCGYGIPDPYGGTVDDYERTFDKIAEGMDGVFAEYAERTKKRRGRPKTK